MTNKDPYLNPCYYHQCKIYSTPKDLLDALDEVYKTTGKNSYLKVISGLGILGSTVSH
jgi:hypothetical protein